MRPATRSLLLTLAADTDVAARVGRDPLRYAHRYADPADAELAGLFAALYAYGRVDLFFPVLDRLFQVVDAAGGPRRWVEGFHAGRDAATLADVSYRWTKPADLVVFVLALQRVLADHGRVEHLFRGTGDLRDRLDGAIGTLRQAISASGVPFAAHTQGVRYLLPAPADGSACKRWNLYLRWMVRPRDGVDLGVWTTLSPADLVMPVDVHVGRIARFLGLTRRTDASWRTAAEITDALRRLDPHDPVRFDFALAHQGISGGCRGWRHAPTCAPCALRDVCRAPRTAPERTAAG